MGLGINDVLVFRIKDLEIIYLNNSMKIRHFPLRKPFPDDIIHEKNLSFRVVYKMMYVA